ncbi:hypothetical protein SKAU_G00362830 [Synaphobranchus kaupii]|uniref:Uncharacterized protein n=1 Tax=Synaphobranchus kaupii TaxID=118154 RepID=A0A9Q1IH11_SYNKA|nr:hypothetical protein SKAU_G00362830 [Synaphobranchus kaupii]
MKLNSITANGCKECELLLMMVAPSLNRESWLHLQNVVTPSRRSSSAHSLAPPQALCWACLLQLYTPLLPAECMHRAQGVDWPATHKSLG